MDGSYQIYSIYDIPLNEVHIEVCMNTNQKYRSTFLLWSLTFPARCVLSLPWVV
jgi:hypothetical protein